MDLYRAYGLVIKSSIKLFDEIVTDKQPDVIVKIAKLEEQSGHLLNKDRSSQVFGTLPGIARFLIKDGTEILIDPDVGIDELVLRPCILGSAMAVLLQQRGFLVLHASCVVIDGMAVAFLGHSGDGKSTICSAFYRHGYEILTDDVMAIRLEQDVISVIPSIPEIKLRSDSADSMGYKEGRLSPLHPLTKKKVHLVREGFFDKPVPLQKIYLLGKGEQNQIQTLSNHESFIELIRHTRAVKTLRSQNLERAHFQKCVTIARNIPISKLVRKFSLSELPDVINIVEKDLQDLKIKQHIQEQLFVKTYSNSEV